MSSTNPTTQERIAPIPTTRRELAPAHRTTVADIARELTDPPLADFGAWSAVVDEAAASTERAAERVH